MENVSECLKVFPLKIIRKEYNSTSISHSSVAARATVWSHDASLSDGYALHLDFQCCTSISTGKVNISFSFNFLKYCHTGLCCCRSLPTVNDNDKGVES